MIIKNMGRVAAGALLACSLSFGAAAQTSIGLQNYVLSGSYTLDTLNGRGLEASAVSYARDRGSLFFVGDEGLGVVEVSLTGATLGSMAFTWPAASSNHDAEGLAYLGNGVLVVAEERLQTGFRFGYSAGGTAALQSADQVAWGAPTGNTGTEGIAYDARNGTFFTVKQSGPQLVLGGSLSFAAPPAGGTSGLQPLFDPALLGLASLSDIASLGAVDALAAAPAGDNLLLLSLDSRRLVEVNRQGQLLSSLDLAALTPQAIEGLTVDENGVIYLVAESAGASLPSQLLVLSAVPEPASASLLGAGVLLLAARRRRAARR